MYEQNSTSPATWAGDKFVAQLSNQPWTQSNSQVERQSTDGSAT